MLRDGGAESPHWAGLVVALECEVEVGLEDVDSVEEPLALGDEAEFDERGMIGDVYW